MDKKKRKMILIIFFSLSIGIGQFSFFIATSSHMVWEQKAPTSNGNGSFTLTTYPFVPDRYDLYAFIKQDSISFITGSIRLNSLATGISHIYNYEIIPEEGGMFIKFNLLLSPGKYDVNWTSTEPNITYLLSTHGLWNHIPNRNSPSDLEILVCVISGIFMGLSFVGVFLQLRAYRRYKMEQKSSINIVFQEPESRNENTTNVNSDIDQLSIPKVEVGHHKKQKSSKKETEINPYRQASEEELEKIESEMRIEEPDYNCIVHKGPIIGPSYLCPYCKMFYCLNCANALKEKGETCWNCHNKFK